MWRAVRDEVEVYKEGARDPSNFSVRNKKRMKLRSMGVIGEWEVRTEFVVVVVVLNVRRYVGTLGV